MGDGGWGVRDDETVPVSRVQPGSGAWLIASLAGSCVVERQRLASAGRELDAMHVKRSVL